MPVLLIQTAWNFKDDVFRLREIFLNRDAEVAFVSLHHAVMVFPLHVLEIMDVVDACRRHVIGMYDTSYSAAFSFINT